MRSIISFFAGLMLMASVLGLHQNSFGSREAYCAYLADGHWVSDGSTTCLISVIVTSIVMTLVVASHFIDFSRKKT